MDIETLGMTFNGKCNMISQRYVDMLIQRSVAGFGGIQNNVIHRLNQFLIDMRHQLLILLLLLRFGQNEHLLGAEAGIRSLFFRLKPIPLPITTTSPC